MTTILGGCPRNVHVADGGIVKVQVKAVLPTCDVEREFEICQANGWQSERDFYGNLVVKGIVSISAYRLNDRAVMDAYTRFAKTAAKALTGKENYYMAGVVSYDAA